METNYLSQLVDVATRKYQKLRPTSIPRKSIVCRTLHICVPKSGEQYYSLSCLLPNIFHPEKLERRPCRFLPDLSAAKSKVNSQASPKLRSKIHISPVPTMQFIVCLSSFVKPKWFWILRKAHFFTWHCREANAVVSRPNGAQTKSAALLSRLQLFPLTS